MIYVDYTECLPKSNITFHGGANYGKRMIELLARNNFPVTVLIPSHCKCFDSLFFYNNVRTIIMDKLEEFVSEEKTAILFIPLLPIRRLNIISNIKKNNPHIKIYITIHGVRRLDLYPDNFDRFYFKGMEKTLYIPCAWIRYFIYRWIYKYFFKKYIPLYDKIFTVSNDSMQKILKISTPKDIKPFYGGSVNVDTIHEMPQLYKRGNYFLFVSGGRKEKNLVRTMIAFQQFKKHDFSGIKLVVTGVSDELKTRLLNCRELTKGGFISNIEFKPYVDEMELRKLYMECKFFIYTSKSEGFGLPLIEACYYGVPILASARTALPEVLGSSVIYVDPYSISSIQKGMEKILALDYKTQQEKVLKRQETVKVNIESSDFDFIAEFKINDID